MLKRMCRTQAVLVVLSTKIIAQAASTLTAPVTITSRVPYESVTTLTTTREEVLTTTIFGQGRPMVDTLTQLQDVEVVSTITGTSTIEITTDSVIVTTMSPEAEPEAAATQSEPLLSSNQAAAPEAILTEPPTSANNEQPEPTLDQTSRAVTTETSTETSTPVTGTNDPQSQSGGLSLGAKAGIALGILLAAFTVVIGLFALRRRRFNHRPSPSKGFDTDNDDVTTIASEKQLEAATNHHKPENMTHPAYEGTNARLSNPIELTGFVYGSTKKEEGPTYVGVPAHLTGEKRWSKD